MKTIFITSFHILISRNIIASPAMDILRRDQNLRIIILVPERKREFFERTFGGGNVIIVGVRALAGRRDGYLRYCALASVKTHSLDLKRHTELAASGAVLSRLIAGSRFVQGLVRALDQFLLRKTGFKELFEG